MVLFPQTQQETKKLHTAIMAGQVAKTYLARVRGKFPVYVCHCVRVRWRM
jgi:23S rRNA-/tRNA-specific pseudouridylate synthase